MTKCRTNLIGIQLVYCVNGEKREVWLDLKQVHALSWCDGDLKEKKGGAGNNKLPIDTSGPGACPKAEDVSASTDVPICWWNGSEWVCGEEI